MPSHELLRSMKAHRLRTWIVFRTCRYSGGIAEAREIQKSTQVDAQWLTYTWSFVYQTSVLTKTAPLLFAYAGMPAARLETLGNRRHTFCVTSSLPTTIGNRNRSDSLKPHVDKDNRWVPRNQDETKAPRRAPQMTRAEVPQLFEEHLPLDCRDPNLNANKCHLTPTSCQAHKMLEVGHVSRHTCTRPHMLHLVNRRCQITPASFETHDTHKLSNFPSTSN